MEKSGNPAQRLYEIITNAEKVFRQTPTSSAWLVWAKVFDLDDSNSRENQLKIISRVEQARNLVDQVENLLLKNEDINHEKYLRPFPKIKELFTSPFELIAPFKSFFKLGGADITGLEFGIDAVSKVYKEKAIDETELKSLLTEIQNLYENIIKSEIDKKLKRILLDMLKVMENAIHEYRIRGIERLSEAIEQLVGIYVFNKDTIETSNAEEIGKVKKILNKFNAMYSFAADTVQLLGAGEVVKNTGEFITKLLDSGQ